MTTFFRLLDAAIDDKATGLRQVVSNLRRITVAQSPLPLVFERAPEAFADVPGSPFAYWASGETLETFKVLSPLEHGGRVARQGLCTTDDFRWVRLGWETDGNDVGGPLTVPFAKGGAFAPFYSDVHLSVRWGRDGRWIKEWKTDQLRLGRTTANNSRCWNESLYFRPGLTWALRTQSGLGVRVMPAGCIFGHKGPAVSVAGDSPADLLALLAVATSSSFHYLVSLQMAFGSYEVGVIQRTPVPDISPQDTDALSRLARRAWSLKRTLDTTNETSHAFTLPPVSLGRGAGGEGLSPIEQELIEIQREIDDRAFALYGISDEDRHTIEAASSRKATPENAENETDDDSDDDSEVTPAVPVLAANSWLVGISFGRFDKRLATGERPIPPEPEPFDPLPTRSPGMWPEGEPRTPPPDILADDPGSARDITEYVIAARGGSGVGGTHDIRPWLAHEFFPLHIKMYSKSRRKAPIYWQLAPPSASYSVWLYIHAFTRDTLYKVQNDYVAPKVAHEERKLESLRAEVGPSAKVGDRKALAEQETFVDELRAFLDEVKRVAPLWNPNLDDGVIINFAPLWRLVPHHKPWQKELKTTWDALCAGDYDWAHLAMHLWPERVVPKCLTDRSLAIAHGLEEDLWVEGDGGKWKARVTPKRPLEDIVRERSSAAVKAALKALLEAPTAGGAVKRGRKGKRDA